MRSNDCTCTSGTEDNGWHEVRCQPCVQHELEEFSLAVRRFRDALDRSIRRDEYWSLLDNGYIPSDRRIINTRSL